MTTRLLTRLFIRNYLHPDPGHATDGQHALATGIALLVSPGLFITVILATKYVLTPFPNPGEAALMSFFDHLFFFSTSWVALALVAVLQWDRLALDSRDANTLGILPIPTRRIVRAKWIATAWLAVVAATVLNALPSLIYPLLSVARLESPALLVLWLAAWHFVVAMIAGVTGFATILALREALWAVFGPRWFGALSAAVQAVLVVVLVAALFLLPSLTAEALRRGASGAGWLPPAAFVAVFEAGGGRLIVELPSTDLPPSVQERARRAESAYRTHQHSLNGVAAMALAACGALAAMAMLLAVWNGRRLPPSVPAAGARRRWSRLTGDLIGRYVVRHPTVQSGFFLTLRTLTRSQPHRLALAVALAVGLAAGAVGLVGQPRPSLPWTDVPLPFLTVQHVLLMCLAAGLRTALRHAADPQASWVFSLAWNTDRQRYVSGVVLAGWTVLIAAALVLAPLYYRFVGAGGAALHAVCGCVLGLVLVELVLVTEPTVPLTTSAPATESTKAAVVLGTPVALGVATGIAALERAAPGYVLGLLASVWCVLHLTRRARHAERQPWRQPAEDEMQGLGLHR